MKKRIFITIIVFCAVFIMASVIKVHAGTSDNVVGWLWGGSEDCDMDQNGFKDVLCGGDNITTPVDANGDSVINKNETGLGWISMNSSYCDTNDDGSSEAASGCPVAGGVMGDYGVNISSSTGDLSGYAWSPNVGWISFAASYGPYPCPRIGGHCSHPPSPLNVDLITGKASGWAQILSMGSDGWIEFNNTWANGVSIDWATGKFSGYAWSDKLGWIDFSKALIPPPPTVSLSPETYLINVDEGDGNPRWMDTPGTAVDLTWAITGKTVCTKSANNTGSWSTTNDVTSSGTETIRQTVPDVIYTLTCTGVIAQPVTAHVYTVCYNHACGSGNTCDKTTMNPGVYDDSSCTNTCTTDADCAPKLPAAWKEIAPKN